MEKKSLSKNHSFTGEDKEEKADPEEDKTSSSSATNGGNPAKSPASTTASNTKRVFSNWGGAFFKKNLDYRANTNKILEKMTMASSAAAAAAASSAPSNGDGLKSAFSPPGPSSPTKRPFDVMAKLSSPPGGSSAAGPDAAKKFKSGFSFGSSFGQSPPPGPPNNS